MVENFEQNDVEKSLREIDWVKKQISTELQGLQKDVFYTKETDKVIYDMDTVKNYLESIKNKSRQKLVSKNLSAFIMAVQIALKSMKDGKGNQLYDIGKIDGIFGYKTKEMVKNFQKNNGLKCDGLPGQITIQKILEKLGSTSHQTTTEQTETSTETPAKTPGATKVEAKNGNEHVPPAVPESKTSESAEAEAKRKNEPQGFGVKLTNELKNDPKIPGVIKYHGLFVPLTEKMLSNERVVGYKEFKDAVYMFTMFTKKERSIFEQQWKKGTKNITYMRDERCEELVAKHKGELLDLSGLTSLTDKQAEILAEHKRTLRLNGLTTLSNEQAKILARHEGDLILGGLTTLSEEQTKSLAKCKGDLWLSNQFVSKVKKYCS